MPICQNCNSEWTWKQTVKRLLMFNLRCPNCGKKQYETTSSKRRGSLFIFIPAVILPINALFNFNWIILVIFMLGALTVFFIVYPFILKLSNELEALW